MPISEAEWASVQAMIEKKVAEKGEAFTTSVVIKRDPDRRVIWTRDFGDEPIPVVAFNNYVRTFDTMGSQVIVRDLSANVIVPQVGDTVLIARELGTRRLPRCLGVINGAGITSGDPATNGSGPSPDNRLGPKTALITDWNSAAETGWYRCGPGAANSPSGGDGFWIGEIVSHRPFSEPGIGDPWITQEVWAFTQNQPQQHRRRVCLNGAWSTWVSSSEIFESATPPANPQIGDLWLYHPIAGVSWIFRYEPDQDAALPWQFVGGPPYSQQETGPVFSCPAYNTWYNAGKISWTSARNGRFVYTLSVLTNNVENNWAALHVGLGAGAGAPGVYGKALGHLAAGSAPTVNVTWEEPFNAGVARQLWCHTTNVGGVLTNPANQYYQWFSLAITPVKVAHT